MNIAAVATIIFTSISTGLRAEVCNTPGCWEIANFLNKSMDLTVDPCDDFWTFVCGNYIKSLDVTDTLYYGVYNDMLKESQEKAREIFEVKYSDEDPEWLKKVRNYYSSCMDTERLDKYSVEKMKTLLEKLGGWPVLNHDWNETDFNWVDVQKKLTAFGKDADQLIKIYAEISDDELANVSIGLDIRGHDLRLWSFNDGIDGLQTYLEALVGIAMIFGAERERAEQDMHEVVVFELALAEIARTEEDTKVKPVPKNISELQKAWLYVSWLDLIQSTVEDPNILENQNVTVDDPFYIENLGDLLSNTSKRVLANYLMTRVVFANGLFLNEEVRNWYLSVLYEETPPPRTQQCFDMVQDDMIVAVAAAYIRNYFPLKEKNEAMEMAELLREEFIKLIEASDWVSNSTKARGVGKARNIKLKIGYPDELMNDTLLNDYYKDLKICPWSMWKNQKAIRKWNNHHSLRYLNQLIFDKWDNPELLITIMYPNAFFQPCGPFFVAYAGTFEGLQYSADRPLNVNLGTLGSTFGHEYTHSVDNNGRYVNEKGQDEDWWDKVSEGNYNKSEKALADEYSSYKVEAVNMTLNGSKEIGEIIADHGGFKIARNAMDAASRQYPSLPGLEQFSAEQIYWISSAFPYCSKTEPRVIKYLIKEDVHPLDEWRVKGSFRMSPQFAQDWSCPVGSFMNPKNKFNVW